MAEPSGAKTAALPTRIACKDCRLVPLCLPPGLRVASPALLEPIIRRRPPLQRGEHLFHVGSAFHSIFAVRSGALKTYVATEDGQEQVTGFYLPGELIGLDAVDCETHPVSAKALETTALCEIPYAALARLCEEAPGLQRQLTLVVTGELRHQRELLMLMGKKCAEERLAGLLINLADRSRSRSLSTGDFMLCMSRNDIANYLGMAVETVSRLFTRFQEEGLLTVQRKHVHILDMGALRIPAESRPGPAGTRRRSH